MEHVAAQHPQRLPPSAGAEDVLLPAGEIVKLGYLLQVLAVRREEKLVGGDIKDCLPVLPDAGVQKVNDGMGCNAQRAAKFAAPLFDVPYCLSAF